MRRRILLTLAGHFVALLVLLPLSAWALSRPRPQGVAGPEADALARKVEVAVGKAAWDQLGGVRFRYAGDHRFLWDRRRGRVRVEFGDHTAWIELSGRTGVAEQDGARLAGAEAQAVLAKGYAWFCNDSFWFNPALKLFDEGVERELLPSGELLVRYGSGGVTPGDTYVYELGADSLPVAWRMWVQVLPVGGLRARWLDWTRFDNGAAYAATRRLGPLPMRADEVAVAGTVEEIEPDGFAPLEATAR